jgi:hypothetical protein
MPDLEITCSECNSPFVFTEREQEYYRERNLTHPKRCKPCRDARRANFGSTRAPSGDRHPDGRSCVAIVLARAVRSLVVKLQRAETSTSEIERVQG